MALQEQGGLSGLGLGLWPGRVRGGDTPLPLILGENPSPGGEIPGAAGREAWKRTA